MLKLFGRKSAKRSIITCMVGYTLINNVDRTDFSLFTSVAMSLY